MSQEHLKSSTITIERSHFNNFVEELSKIVGKVYYIGKDDRGYEKMFNKFTTIDINRDKKPDISCDFCSRTQVNMLPQMDAIICNGVYEQCSDPTALLDNIHLKLKQFGILLLGCVSVGYPLYDTDYQRITPAGMKRVMEKYQTMFYREVMRDDVVSYIYFMGRKK